MYLPGYSQGLESAASGGSDRRARCKNAQPIILDCVDAGRYDKAHGCVTFGPGKWWLKPVRGTVAVQLRVCCLLRCAASTCVQSTTEHSVDYFGNVQVAPTSPAISLVMAKNAIGGFSGEGRL